jgi:hypothetical protein
LVLETHGSSRGELVLRFTTFARSRRKKLQVNGSRNFGIPPREGPKSCSKSGARRLARPKIWTLSSAGAQNVGYTERAFFFSRGALRRVQSHGILCPNTQLDYRMVSARSPVFTTMTQRTGPEVAEGAPRRTASVTYLSSSGRPGVAQLSPNGESRLASGAFLGCGGRDPGAGGAAVGGAFYALLSPPSAWASSAAVRDRRHWLRLLMVRYAEPVFCRVSIRNRFSVCISTFGSQPILFTPPPQPPVG